MDFTTDEYFAAYDDALAKLTQTVENQQTIIEALFNAVNDARVIAHQPPLLWQDLVSDDDEGA